jgi:hypothetical protein
MMICNRWSLGSRRQLVAEVMLMKRLWVVLVLGLTGLMAEVGVAAEPEDAPDGWRSYAARPEIAPRFWVEPAKDPGHSVAYSLGLAGCGDDSVDGRWVRTLPVEAGKYYAFRAEHRAEKVDTPARCILARVLWFDARGKQLGQAEYPLTSPHPAKDRWTVLTGIYQAPDQCAKAQLELHLRWAAHGQVLWRNADLKETTEPASRKVRLATVNHRPRDSKSS